MSNLNHTPRTLAPRDDFSNDVGDTNTSNFSSVQLQHCLVKNSSSLDLLAQRLMRAVRAPDDFGGALRCLQVLGSCLSSAGLHWQDASFRAWAEVARQTQNQVQISCSENEIHFLTPPSSRHRQFQQLLDWVPPTTQSGTAFNCHALLGRAVARAAITDRPIPIELLPGLLTLRRGSDGKRNRSAGWDRAINITISDSTEVGALIDQLPVKCATVNFLKSALAVLEWRPVGPPLQPSSDLQPTIGNIDLNNSAEPERRTDANGSDFGDLKEVSPKEILPDIGVRKAAANYATSAEKLGLPQRDRLLIGDLAHITKQLFKLSSSGSTKEQGFAVFAATSLVTGCADSTCLKLGFQRSQDRSIWLEVEKGAWSWDFAVYRQDESDPSRVRVAEPIYCPLPAFVTHHLCSARSINPNAQNLGDLIQTLLRDSAWNLDGYRAFLNNLGHPAHPPLRSRFAKSFASVILDETKSDMTTALVSGYFESSAPGALHYFGPTSQLIAERCESVFDRLSLGPISPLFTAVGRVGCQKVLELEQLQAGWVELCSDIKMAQASCRTAMSIADKVCSCNLLMSLLASAFVIQSGHRGSKLERLTAGALFANPDLMIVDDKYDDEGHAHPRLLPKTPVVRQILFVAAECRLRLRNLEKGTVDKHLALDVSEPFFVTWKFESGALRVACANTSLLSNLASKYFNADVNFARSAWVTYLDTHECDRWLIRALTGHTRDITRLHGPHFDVPPSVVASRLSLAMQKVGEVMFGNLDISIASKAAIYPELTKVNFGRVSDKKVTYGPVPDPKTLLSAPNTATLLEHQLVEQIRSYLLLGKIEGPAYVLAALHLALIDLIPDRDLCLETVGDKSKVIMMIGAREGLKWHRSHFVEATWIPIQPTTSILLGRIEKGIPGKSKIIAEICNSVRNSGIRRLPKSDPLCWLVMTSAAESFRRLIFPPSICAVSDLSVPAPALSEFSLRRLAGEIFPSITTVVTTRDRRSQNTKKDEDINRLFKRLGEFSSTAERLGEKQARAAKCLNSLDEPPITWSPLANWFREWVEDELQRTRARYDGCYQISSISTYLSTLTLGQNQLDAQNDPKDWEDDEWSAWVSAINVRCGGVEYPEDRKSSGLLQERAKDALAALTRSLRRRREYVPVFLSDLLAVTDKKIQPRGSASSCLITPQDTDRALKIISIKYSDHPGNSYLLKFRLHISLVVALRAGDISSLKALCLTQGGGLVIERVGYNQHKSAAAIRVVQLNHSHEQDLRQLMGQLHEHFGSRILLLRGDGSADEGLRDLHLSIELGTILKQATGDPKARPHSVRAATLQETVWPEWQVKAASMMSGNLGVHEANHWRRTLEQDWTRLSSATAMAGQADLRSALGNYLAGWPLVYSVLTCAALATSVPGPGFLTQLKINPEALRQARSRSSRPKAFEGSSTEFDPWAWIANRHGRAVTQAPPTTSLPKSDFVRNVADSSDANLVSDSVQLNYLVQRCFGLQESLSMESARIPLHKVKQLEQFLPTRELIDAAVRRGRQAPQPRAIAADREMAVTELGQSCLHFLLVQDISDFKALRHTLFRTNTTDASNMDIAQFWPRVIRSLPPSLALDVRIGARYLSLADRIALSRLEPAAFFKPDPQIGERPVMAVLQRGQKNLVVSARLTSVIRVAWLAIDALRTSKKTGAKHAV